MSPRSPRWRASRAGSLSSAHSSGGDLTSVRCTSEEIIAHHFERSRLTPSAISPCSFCKGSCGRRRALDPKPPALVKQLGQLDGVRGGALAQVVGDDPDIERSLVAGIAADSPDVYIVLARRLDRERVASARWIVHHGHAGSLAQQLTGTLRRELLSGLHVHRLRVPGHDGHPHAGGADANRGVAEDLARLVHQLALLVGVILALGEA